MNHSGALPPGQPGYPGQQQQQQQQQQFAGYQQTQYATQQQPPPQNYQLQQEFGYPGRLLGYTPEPTPAPQFQAQNDWAYYNTGNGGYGGVNGSMGMAAQEQYMAPQAAWGHQQQQTQAPRPQQQQQQSYQMPSPQMQQAMNGQPAHYGHQGQSQYQGQAQQMGHMQQPPRRSPSISQQHQQMRQRPSPQIQHQPSPQLQHQPSPQIQHQSSPQVRHQPSPQVQHQPSPQLQQQQFAVNSPIQQAQSYQQRQQTQHVSRVPSQQAQTYTPAPAPLQQQQQREAQVLQPQARPQPQVQKQPQPQVQVKPKPESARTSFQGHSRTEGQARPQVPSQTQNQTRQVPPSQRQTQNQPPAPQSSRPPTTTSPDPLHEQPYQNLAPAEEQMQFVNLQDIQAMPRPKGPPAARAPQSAPSKKQSYAPIDKSRSSSGTPKLPTGGAARASQSASPKKQASLQPPLLIQKARSPSGTPKLPSGGTLASKSKVQKSSTTSVSQSPGTPSGRLSTSQSPAMPTKKAPTSDAAVLTAAAEQMIEKARSAVSIIALNPQSNEVEEYQKMISTGLACFEAALQGKRLTPRQEARVRLRYAAVLHEETENIADAETTLSKGITLCDKHRLHDLKYCMQYLMMKVLFQRNRKAGLKALDQHIADCNTYQHVHWAYAFRLLKASFYEESGNAADATSLENMRAIQSMAATRGDVAMSVYASLSEALILLKTSRGTSEAVRNCLAQASKHQFDEQAKIPQLEILSLVLDVVAGLHRDSQDMLGERLSELKQRLGVAEGTLRFSDFLIPIKRSPSGSQTISPDTSAIIRPGDIESQDKDSLVMKFMTQTEMGAIVFSLSGLNGLHSQHRAQHNTAKLWRNGLNVLKHYDTALASTKKPAGLPLKQAIEQREWRMRAQTFFNIMLGLLAVSHCQWTAVQQAISTVEEVSGGDLDGSLKAFYCYLKGAYYQGTGELENALAYFQDESLSHLKKQPALAAQQHLALLAGINRLWIMQRPDGVRDWPCENHALTRELMDELNHLCSNHHVLEIRVAWSQIWSTTVQYPPIQRNARKEFASRALNLSKQSDNVFAKLVSIVGSRELLFANVLGDQSIKCIQAGVQWSKKSNNPLWQSLAFGSYSELAEARNNREESEAWFEQGVKAAQAAFQQGP